MRSAGARTFRSKVCWKRATSRSSIGWAFTMAALLIRMSIWKVPFLEKWDFAAEMRAWGAVALRRSARTGRAVMLYFEERVWARSWARASDEGVA